MTDDWSTPGAIAPLIAAAFTLLAVFVAHWLTARAKLVAIRVGGFAFVVNQQIVYTQTIEIRSIGRKSAENVRISFNIPPMHIEIFPTTKYHTHADNATSAFFIEIDQLPPRSARSLQLLSVNNQLPRLVSIQHSGGEVSIMSPLIQPLYPRWAYVIASLLALLGAFVVVAIAMKNILSIIM